LGIKQFNDHYFDTLKVAVADTKAVQLEALKQGINLRYFSDQHVGISIDETTSPDDIKKIAGIFAIVLNKKASNTAASDKAINWPASLVRTSPYLTHPVFNTHHSEHEMLRY